MGAGGVCGQVTVDRVILFGPGGFPGWVGFQVGGVAQLGERLLCKQEVIGSIPLASTSLLWELVSEGNDRDITGKTQVRRIIAPCERGVFGVSVRCSEAPQRGRQSVAIIQTVNQVLVRLWACRG